MSAGQFSTTLIAVRSPVSGSAQTSQPEFRHEVGFVRRAGIQRTDAAYIWQPQPDALNLKQRVLRSEVVYVFRPGDNVFFVFNQTTAPGVGGRDQQDRAVMLKWTCSLDF